MSVTFGGWAPAPEPDINAKLAMAILPQMAQEMLRQQSPEGQADMALRQQQLELQKQRMMLAGQAEQRAGQESQANIQNLGVRTAGEQQKQGQSSLLFPMQQQGAAQGLRAGEAGILGIMAKLKEDTARSLLIAKQADKANIEVARFKGEQDVESWNGQSAERTPEGLAYARQVYRQIAGDMLKAEAIISKANKPQHDALGNVMQIPEEQVQWAESVRAKYGPLFDHYSSYLNIKKQAAPRRVTSGNALTVEQLMKDNPGLTKEEAEENLARNKTDVSDLSRAGAKGGPLGLGTAKWGDPASVTTARDFLTQDLADQMPSPKYKPPGGTPITERVDSRSALERLFGKVRR